VNSQTNKIHTSFNQTITSTGRLSSNNPNLQNIPIREERGREIRKAFIPSGDEYTLFSADYSQIELRIMAHMSEDPNLIEAYKKELDIHTVTASKIYNVSLDQVTGDMRRKAKTANFGIIYGISVYGLSQRLSIPRAEAGELIEGYFKNYPKVKEYMDRTIQFAREYGYVKTIMGRRRYLKDIASGNSIVRGMAERNAINAPIQGSASDIIKMAMIQIDNQLAKKQYRSKMILQVHDELVFDVYKPELEDIQKIVVENMENIITLEVPLTVEAGSGNNWLEAH
jgi:DNA polymerase-1